MSDQHVSSQIGAGSTLLEVLRFEAAYQRRSPLFLLVAAFLFLLAFLGMASESVSIGGGAGDNMNLNASYVIMQSHIVLTIIAMFAGIAFVATAVTRDHDLRTAELFYVSGVRERTYLFGRFLGGVGFAVLASLLGLSGTLFGEWMPWLDAERLGAFTLTPYLYSAVVVVVPNLLITGALFFAVAALTRSMGMAYAAAMLFIAIFTVLGLVVDQEDVTIAGLLDPFGGSAFAGETRYWTVAERNHALPGGLLITNRLLWLAIAAAALALTAWRFRFRLDRFSLRRGRAVRAEPAAAAPALEAPAKLAERTASPLRQWWSQTRLDVRGVIFGAPFYVVLAVGVLNVAGGFYAVINETYGTPVYPVTAIMLETIQGSFLFVVLVIIFYYAGELVHRERACRISDIVDSAPYPNGVMVLAKVAALWFVITAMLAVVVVVALIIQALNGYTRFEPWLYLRGVFGVMGWQFYVYAVVAIFFQSVIANRWLGMMAFVGLIFALIGLNAVGFEHNLYSLSIPTGTYSDMNGYGHFAVRTLSYAAYWSAFACMLLVVAHLFFVRGNDTGADKRLAEARRRFGTGSAGFLVASVLFAAGIGGFIFYNTNVLNEYLTEDDLETRQADYEKQFKKHLRNELPQVASLEVAVDIYPETRRLDSRGFARLYNPYPAPMTDLVLWVNPELEVGSLTLGNGTLAESDPTLGHYRYEFDTPLEQGDEVRLDWQLAWRNEGFRDQQESNRVVENGTFVDSTEILPLLGYNRGVELTDNNVRRGHGLPPVERAPALDDPHWRGVNQFGLAERSEFKATLSTAADQIAIAPGYLKREWQSEGRRYFEYEMDERIWPFASFSSARYDVAKDEWKGVEIAVYHDAKHAYNVDSMIRSTKRSLDYFNEAFSPYQYRQFRILEFPRYATFAQSFPNTIPYSEGIGFIADLRDEDTIDYVFYVTAHELAHQWWGHQVVGAFMQGMTVIVETLAQYSALMVMEQEFGAEKMRRFLKYELDNYLRSRGSELIAELPLVKVENQGYIHYRKGSVVMYALKDAIGEERVNEALRRFIAKHGPRERHFPSAADLVAEFRAVADDEHQALITALFEEISLYDLAVERATSRPVDDGIEVTLEVTAARYVADGQGVETPAPFVGAIDIGIFGESEGLGPEDLPTPLYLAKHELNEGTNTFRLVVPDAAAPVRVGVDPYAKMIDRNPDDNLKRIE